MVRSLVVGSALLVVLASGCTAGGSRDSGPPDAAPGSPAPDVEATTVSTRDLDALPRARSRLPARVPVAGTDVPGLLDDLPGRALMTYHPPEVGFTGPSGWATEDVYFYGADGRWRLLEMEDLGLPDSAWVADTYGPGALSSDGRWWASFSDEGPIVLDLATGRLVDTEIEQYVAPPEWIPGEPTLVAHGTVGRGRTVSYRVDARTGEVSKPPYVAWQVGFGPDGTAWSLRVRRGEDAELVRWDGDVETPVAVLPDSSWRQRTASRRGVLATEDHVAFVEPGRPTTLRVIDAGTGAAVATLTWTGPRRAHVLVEGWLDDRTLLLAARGGTVAWQPFSGRVSRVTIVPDAEGYWTVAVARHAVDID